MANKEFAGAGGTRGGTRQFLIGLIMAGVGAYLLLNQVEVTTAWWHFGNFNTFGLSLLPLLVGIGILFFNGKSAAGWILALLGFAIILAGILMNMDIYFRRTSLYNTLIMLVLLAGGFGLIVKSLQPKPGSPNGNK
jgi:predicted membrane channel-forming protein YqfA (hemolysin III family)